MARRTWPNEDAFYTDEDGGLGEARAASGERDYGVWWREHDSGPRWRISMIQDTDEVIAVCAGGEMAGQVVLLAEGIVESECEDLLGGWTDHIFDVSGLGWARGRLGPYSPL